MPDVYSNFARALLAQTRYGNSAPELYEARRAMMADPNYDEGKHHAVVLVVEAIMHQPRHVEGIGALK
jgi:hypothetical protein